LSKLVSQENLKFKNTIRELDRRIEAMHQAFIKYYCGDIHHVPAWEQLENELVTFSRKSVFDVELSLQLDRILHKFQNRKKIWRKWIDETHGDT
jgi:hypothetical protein